MKFPKGFIFGAATASYQVEGAAHEGGRSECIWDTFSRIPGRVFNSDNGETAADQYHRYKEDIAIMKELGIESYRFSISWSRILPDLSFRVNQEGVEYYRSLLTELRQNGIKPCITLYHWDLPQYLENRGGWKNRETPYLFQRYAEICFRAFGDLSDMWITLNEPWCISYLGYIEGVHAPGVKDDFESCCRVIHHLNLAHGLAVKTFRHIGMKGMIGITWNPSYERCYKGEEELSELQYAIDTGVFTEPVFHGRYPEILDSVGYRFPIEEGDMKTISEPIDFYGVNYYTNGKIVRKKDWPFCERIWEDVPRTYMGWPVVPEGLVRCIERLNGDSGGLDVYITENGACYDDVVTDDGKVHDAERMEYIRLHFKAMQKILKKGIPLRGYYLWSLLDNYEWSFGYSRRFGIVRVDYETGERTIKDSGYYYSKLIREAH